jgi:hypothetical protein
LSNLLNEKLDIIYPCPKAGIEVHLKVNCQSTKGFFGKKYLSQEIKKCDLQAQGGCTVKLEPAFSSKCPAVAKALKNSLK